MARSARAQIATLSETVVSDAGLLARTTSPERRALGSWDVWPALRDAGTPAAVERGEYDDRLEELGAYARAHGCDAIAKAIASRLGTLGIEAAGAPAAPDRSPDPEPFKTSALRVRTSGD